MDLTKCEPKLPSKMTKFELDRTFMKKLGLFITNTPQAVAVENSHWPKLPSKLTKFESDRTFVKSFHHKHTRKFSKFRGETKFSGQKKFFYFFLLEIAWNKFQLKQKSEVNFFPKAAILDYGFPPKNNRLCPLTITNVHTKFEYDWIKTVRASPLANSSGRTGTARTTRWSKVSAGFVVRGIQWYHTYSLGGISWYRDSPV